MDPKNKDSDRRTITNRWDLGTVRVYAKDTGVLDKYSHWSNG